MRQGEFPGRHKHLRLKAPRATENENAVEEEPPRRGPRGAHDNIPIGKLLKTNGFVFEAGKAARLSAGFQCAGSQSCGWQFSGPTCFTHQIVFHDSARQKEPVYFLRALNRRCRPNYGLPGHDVRRQRSARPIANGPTPAAGWAMERMPARHQGRGRLPSRYEPNFTSIRQLPARLAAGIDGSPCTHSSLVGSLVDKIDTGYRKQVSFPNVFCIGLPMAVGATFTERPDPRRALPMWCPRRCDSSAN